MDITRQTMTDEDRKSLVVQYLKAFDRAVKNSALQDWEQQAVLTATDIVKRLL